MAVNCISILFEMCIDKHEFNLHVERFHVKKMLCFESTADLILIGSERLNLACDIS